jgi:hypothetical protein
MTREWDERLFLPLLKQILALWPDRSALHPFLAQGFDPTDLTNPATALRRVEAAEHTNDATVAIQFYDAGGALQRAVFQQVTPDEWKLSSLKVQCPVCFGAGQNEGEECGICAGAGWGAI